MNQTGEEQGGALIMSKKTCIKCGITFLMLLLTFVLSLLIGHFWKEENDTLVMIFYFGLLLSVSVVFGMFLAGKNIVKDMILGVLIVMFIIGSSLVLYSTSTITAVGKVDKLTLENDKCYITFVDDGKKYQIDSRLVNFIDKNNEYQYRASYTTLFEYGVINEISPL